MNHEIIIYESRIFSNKLAMREDYIYKLMIAWNLFFERL